MLEDLNEFFSKTIITRGEEYYNEGKVLSCFKDGNKYYANVDGSSYKPYQVTIEIDKKGEPFFECDCPYENNCKHIYATLVAIDKKEYKEIKLKAKETYEFDEKEILKKISPEELKEALLNSKSKLVNKAFLEKYFYDYMPKQGYDFYYNRLYNDLILERYPEYDRHDNMWDVEEKVDKKDYEEAYNIIKAVLDAYSDTNKLSDISDYYQKIAMYLRIIHRRGDNKLIKDVDKYLDELKKKKYFDNVYLEDALETIK